MNFVIKKNHHRAIPFRFGLWINKKLFQHRVYFYNNCKYDLGSPDQDDTNKLFGVGYFWSHHTDSARFGWKYNNQTGKMVIVAYCYVSGERIIKDICEVPLASWVELELVIGKGIYFFTVKNPNSIVWKPIIGQMAVTFSHVKKWQYRLGLYFGGNRKAPRNMYVNII